MPTRPLPMIFTCTACSWKKRTHPKSDALMCGLDYFEKCPRCGCEVIGAVDNIALFFRKILNAYR